jgi:hypothetical protein
VTRDAGTGVAKVPEGSSAKLNPVMEVAAYGLMPISPVICVVPVVDIPVSARIAKLPADPRSTGACGAAETDRTGIKSDAKTVPIMTTASIPFIDFAILNISLSPDSYNTHQVYSNPVSNIIVL